METVKIVVLVIFLAILVSLGSALVAMVRGKGDSKQMVRALTWRVGLSVALFLLLMIAWSAGLIAPHGIEP